VLSAGKYQRTKTYYEEKIEMFHHKLKGGSFIGRDGERRRRGFYQGGREKTPGRRA